MVLNSHPSGGSVAADAPGPLCVQAGRNESLPPTQSLLGAAERLRVIWRNAVLLARLLARFLFFHALLLLLLFFR